MTAVQRRRRALVRAAFWVPTDLAVAWWLAPHIARQDGVWFLALIVAACVVINQIDRCGR